MTLVTQRLRLRRLTADDAADVYRNWTGDPEVTRYLTWQAHKDIQATRDIIGIWLELYKHDYTYRWCMELRATGEVIGMIDVVRTTMHNDSAHIGYCMGRAWWNKGYMTETLCAVEDFLFSEAEYNRVEACHAVDNPASGEVMKKSGMLYEGVKREGARTGDGRFCDVKVYAMLHSDWDKLGRMSCEIIE